MLIDFELKPEQIEKIKALIDSGKYSDIEQFIQISISNLIKRELIRESESGESIDKTLDDTSDSKVLAKLGSFAIEIDDISESVLKMDSFKISKNIKDFENPPMISNFVTRFFPVKLIMAIIVSYLIKTNKKWFTLYDVDSLVYEYSEKYAEKLKKYEEDARLTRHQKLSTGLPLPEIARQGKRGRASSRIVTKISASRERFLNNYLGHSGKKFTELKDGKTFNEFNFKPGGCMLMGLLGYNWDDNAGEFMLEITDIGKEFLLLNNLIINQNQMQPLTLQESDFIMKKIIPRFKLEKLIIDAILKGMKGKKSIETNTLDEIFEKIKIDYLKENPSAKSEFGIKLLSDIKKLQKCPKCNSKNIEFDPKKQALICQSKRCGHEIKNPNSADRVAIMGRLTEMGYVEWIIGERGKSTYKLGRQFSTGT